MMQDSSFNKEQIYFISPSWFKLPQDLKPSNLAVNEDCELKVSEALLLFETSVYLKTAYKCKWFVCIF